jgi:acetolactate synthase-1/2/3 large subunit
MNGAEALLTTAVSAGIEICFANPGTTELPFVMALALVRGLRNILCLQENVATGAADGYGRMAQKPAMCLLHLGVGLANGLTNLHNARRASTPVLNIIGDHTTWHLPADPLLATDVESLANIVSHYVKKSQGGTAVAFDVADALESTIGGRIATLIVPHDVQIAAAGDVIPPRRDQAKKTYSSGRVSVEIGQSSSPLGGDALSEPGLMLAGRIAAAGDADLLCDTFFARMERGGGLPSPRKLPYFPDEAFELTRRYERVIVAGTRRPVGFFAHSGVPSHVTTEEQTVLLAEPQEDTLGALGALAAEVSAPDIVHEVSGALPAMPEGALNAQATSAVIARFQPTDCIVMDEVLAVGVPYFDSSKHSARFTHLMLTGGAIGQGPSAATGAAVAFPNRKVINFQSDGCGAYSVQALWTQACENLDVVTIIGSNLRYQILEVELLRAGVTQREPFARSLLSLDHPFLNWVKIGEGLGVPGVAVDSAKALARELEMALTHKGPRLIEAIMS